MAKQGNLNFEIPPEMRALAEKSLEQARQAFETFISAANHAVTAADKRLQGAHAGAKEVGELAARFAERNIASSFEFAQQLVRAKDTQEVLSLHSDYVNRQMTTLSDQAKELSREASKMTGAAIQH